MSFVVLGPRAGDGSLSDAEVSYVTENLSSGGAVYSAYDLITG